MTRITDTIIKKPQSNIMVNVRCDKKIYESLKAKLKKNKITVKEFLMASIEVYMSEK